MRKVALLTVLALFTACGSSTSDPGTGFLRVANLAPDLPAVDFCIRTTGTTAWTSGVMNTAGATAGLVYDGGVGVEGIFQVSRYFSYAAGTYDVAVFQIGLPGSACATPMASLTGLVLGNGVSKMVAIVGTGGTGAVQHTLAQFTDETTVATGNVAIRFANTGLIQIPGGFMAVPPIDVGVTTASTGYVPIFVNIAYPGVAPARTTAPVIDANGYATLPASSFGGTVQLTATPGRCPTRSSAATTRRRRCSAGTTRCAPTRSPPSRLTASRGPACACTPGFLLPSAALLLSRPSRPGPARPDAAPLAPRRPSASPSPSRTRRR
jgi:hypothetical protein